MVRVDNFYMVAPFLNPLKKWIARNKDIPPVPAERKQVLATTTTTTTTTESVAIVAGEERALTAAVESASANSMTMSNKQRSPNTLDDRELPNIQREMTVKLKALLSIPTQSESSDGLTSVPEPTNQEKSNALLALLHKNANGTANGTTNRLEQNQRPSGNRSIVSAAPGLEQGRPHHHASGVMPSKGFIPTPPVPVPSSHFANVPRGDRSHLPHPSTAHTGSIQTMTSAPWGNERGGSIAGAPISSQPSVAMFSAHGPNVRSEPASFIRSASDSHQPPHRESSAFAHLGHSTTVHPPMVPVAATLPPPKMTTHSLRLLNAFKGEQGSSRPAPPTPAAGVADHGLGYQGKVDRDRTNLERRSAMPLKERSLGPTTAPGHTSRGPTSQTSLGQRAGQPTDHRDKLLSLFNKPPPASTAATRETLSTVVPDEGPSLRKPVVVSPAAASASESRNPLVSTSSRSRQVSGSSQPTSAANREILMEFLDLVAKKGLDGEA